MAALYWLAVHTDRRTARIGLASTAALLITTALVFDPSYHHPLSLKTVGPAFWVLIPIAWGTAGRLRTDNLEAVHARSEIAERTREEEARHRVAEERMRIARELHDVVAHHLAPANAQAGTAARLQRTHPQQVRKILDDLSGTTASALRELRATVGLLRQADDPDAPLEPSPGLDRLPDLTAAFAVPAAPAPGHGFGLIGMRERALSVGGRLKADHRAEGGFEVSTDLPLQRDRPALFCDSPGG